MGWKKGWAPREGFLLFGKGKCEEWEWGCLALSLGGLFLKVCEWPGPLWWW